MSDSESEHTASSQPAENITRRPRKAKRVSIDASHEICRTPLKLPPFWPEEPEIWFAQIEAQFENAGVTNDVTKFNSVVSHLDPQFSKEVKDVIMSPPTNNRYEKLKTELVKRLSASQEKKVKQLLMHEELGDRKPSQFLRHLQGLAGPSVPEDFVRTIWSSRLPSSIQPLLASQPHSTLEALADLADRVQDIVAPSHVASTSAPGPTVSELAAEIAELKRAMKDLSMQLRDSRSRSRPRSRGRDTRRNSRQRSSSRSDSSYRKHPQCWYHSMHGEKAKRCVKPCDYKKGNAAGSH